MKEKKEYYNENGEHIFILQCECGKEIEIKGCSTCEYRYRNYFDYDEAKKCHECDMLHRNYKYEEN